MATPRKAKPNAKATRKKLGLKETGYHRPRKTLTVRTVVNAMRAAAGIQSLAAEKLGVNRSTVCRFLQDHPELKDELAAIDDELLDLSESGLFEQLRAKEFPAIKFYLEQKGAARGYGKRRFEISGPNGGPIQHRDVSKLTDAEIDILERAALALAGGADSAGGESEPLSGEHQG